LAPFDGDNHAFKNLDPFFVSFFDFFTDLDNISGLKIYFVVFSLSLIEFDDLFLHNFILAYFPERFK